MKVVGVTNSVLDLAFKANNDNTGSDSNTFFENNFLITGSNNCSGHKVDAKMPHIIYPFHSCTEGEEDILHSIFHLYLAFKEIEFYGGCAIICTDRREDFTFH